MPTRNVNLTDHLDNFIESGINSGRYGNASEVVREGLRLLEQQEQENQAKLIWLRTAAEEGFSAIKRGDYTDLETDEEVDALLTQIHDEAVASLSPMNGK